MVDLAGQRVKIHVTWSGSEGVSMIVDSKQITSLASQSDRDSVKRMGDLR